MRGCPHTAIPKYGKICAFSLDVVRPASDGRREWAIANDEQFY